MVTGPEFRLRNIPLLSRVADRSDHLRTDIDAAIAGWADAAVLRVDPAGRC
jgi:NAD+ diphosphatase